MFSSRASNRYNMRNNRSKFCFTWLFHFLHFSCLIHCFKSNFDESLDVILHDHAFRAMIHQRPHTGALYNASLPADLAGMKVSVVGLRSRTLWRKGANFSDFIIPPNTLPVPYVKRLLIVYHNLGNWSSSYYSLSGYSLISPVVGFLVYDASHLSSNNLSKLELNTMGKPISNVCYSKSQGHFSLVIPFKKQQMWPFWIIGFLAGSAGLILLGFAGKVAIRSFVGKRSQEMEKEADERECLQTYWIAGSKMPRAEVTRTQPTIESTTLPNPKLSWYA